MSKDHRAKGIVYQHGGTTHLDTREMDWEPFAGFPGAAIKILSRLESGEPSVMIVSTPPGVMSPVPRRHYHTVREYVFILSGEMHIWEYESADQAYGQHVTMKPGFFMERLPGENGIHGLEPVAGSPTGCVRLTWRDGPGTWRGEPSYQSGSVDVPYPSRPDGDRLDDRVRIADANGVIHQNGAVTHLDTNSMPWEDHFSQFTGAKVKILSRFEDGRACVTLTWVPPDVITPEPPGRRHYHTCSEFSYCLAGELPIWEYASPAVAKGELVMRKSGHYMDRRPGSGSIHGVEPNVGVGPSGCLSLAWRDGTGNWRGEPDYSKNSIEVVYP